MSPKQVINSAILSKGNSAKWMQTGMVGDDIRKLIALGFSTEFSGDSGGDSGTDGGGGSVIQCKSMSDK